MNALTVALFLLVAPSHAYEYYTCDDGQVSKWPSGAAASGTTTGSFSSAVSPYSLTIGVAISRSSAGTSTGDLNFQVTPIPEPETYALMMAGLGALGFVARRRQRG